MSNLKFMQGNEAVVRGAIAAGARFFAGYPITPSSEIAENASLLLPKVDGTFIQMEDEMASLACVEGASTAGVMAFTATSGPGFCVMQEHIGHAVMCEIPCVIVVVQRGGPSTGLATKPAQGDLMQTRWGCNGDHSIIALSPSSVEECYEMTAKAFYYAEKYRTPVVVLSDGITGKMYENVCLRELPPEELPAKRIPEGAPEDYRTYNFDPDNIPVLAPFGTKYQVHLSSAIDIKAAKERSIFACNCPDKNSITTAEMSIALMLACWRRIPMVDHRVKNGEWHKYTYRHDSYELYGKTIGIIGAGRIGRLVMERLQGWGVNIIYFDPYPMTAEMEEKYHARRVDLDTLCREADAISLNCPLTDTTRNIINKEKLMLMKPTTIIVNEARGACINLDDLAWALENNVIWGAAIDVWEPEPCDPNSPLLKMEKVITTSHLGGSAKEALVRVYSEALENTARLFKTGRPNNVQNGL